MYAPSIAYAAPRPLPDALELLGQAGDDARLLAGGQSLIPAMKMRLLDPGFVIDLGRVPELRGVRAEGDTLHIGALTVHADVAAAEVVRQRMPGLAEAANGI